MTGARAFCSVLVPANNAAHLLPRTLGAMLASELARDRWELIVIDDGSTDDTAAVAARYADVVVRLPGKAHGPAYARNRGFEASRGDIVIFIDADVVVHTDTLSRFAQLLESRREVGAVFGSYDERPTAPGLMSQYRNLIHHYVHHANAGPVDTFWAGAGAIRRDVFGEAGMYDEWHYAKPQIEDIELGGRIRANGHQILLDPSIEVTHLKRWTLGAVIRTDLRDRGIPWARLLAHRGAALSSGTLNLRWSEKLNTVLVWLAALLMLLSAVLWNIQLVYGAAACVAIVLAVNMPLWRFFARLRGVWFALRVMPAHLLYYLLNGVSFGIGLMLQQLLGAPTPDPTIDAYAEVGVKRWPPVPSRDRPSSWTSKP